jgi:hypothetical protein
VSAPAATEKSSDVARVEPEPSPLRTLMVYEVPGATLGLGVVLKLPPADFTLSPRVIWKLAPSVRMSETKGVSPDDGVHLMVFAVEKSHSVSELGTTNSKAAPREIREAMSVVVYILYGIVALRDLEKLKSDDRRC